jgi:hypothetical protein
MRAIPPVRLTALVLSFWIGTAVYACPPPIPGMPDPPVPTALERARAIGSAANIVYGIVTREDGSRPARFRIIHVYKGPLRPGAVIEAYPGWGLDAPVCSGMIQPPPAERGTAGVIWFGPDHPEMNFVGDRDLETLFREGLIQSARAGARGSAPN